MEYKEYGDLQAAYRLVTANLRLVVMIARRYESAFRNLFDLIQEGNIGLMEAVKKFDPYRGIRFPSYAVWWIRAYIIRYLMNNFRMVKVGTTQAQRRLFFNLQKEKQKIEAEGFEITPKLIARRLEVKPSEVVEMEQRMSARDVSVDAPVGPGEESTMLDFLPSEQTTEDAVADAQYQRAMSERMREFGKTLTGKDRYDLRGAAAHRRAEDAAGDRRDLWDQPRTGPANRGAPEAAAARLSGRGCEGRAGVQVTALRQRNLRPPSLRTTAV